MVKYYSDIITKVRNSPKQLVIHLSPNNTKTVFPLERGNDNKKAWKCCICNKTLLKPMLYDTDSFSFNFLSNKQQVKYVHNLNSVISVQLLISFFPNCLDKKEKYVSQYVLWQLISLLIDTLPIYVIKAVFLSHNDILYYKSNIILIFFPSDSLGAHFPCGKTIQKWFRLFLT